jgi:hypothetical protein
VYSKRDNLPNPPTTDILGTSIDNGKEFLENGVKPESVKGATGNIMKGTFSYFLNELLGQYDRTTYKTTVVSECIGTRSNIDFNFQTNFVNASIGQLQPGGSLSLKGTYRKTAHTMRATFVFLAREGQLGSSKIVEKKRFTKDFSAQELRGEVNFLLKHTGTMCRENGGVFYSGSNNYLSTWMYVYITHNGEVFQKVEDGVYFWISPIDILKNGATSISGFPYCSYDIELQ